MKIRALALDLDGTLTNSQKEVTPATRAALDAARQKGVNIILASGRPVVGVMPVARELELEKKGGYILAYNGGQILDCATGETLHQSRLAPDSIPRICEFARRRGLAFLTYDREGVITENAGDEYIQKEAWINRLPVRQVEDLPAEVDFPVTKMLVVGPPQQTENAERAMRAQFKGEFDCFRSEPYFLEVVPMGVEKAASLEILLKKLGIEREELMACGDGFNDLPMLRYAGLGVAMANAQSAVKQAADRVTLSNDEDGVAAAVKQYILSET